MKEDSFLFWAASPRSRDLGLPFCFRSSRNLVSTGYQSVVMDVLVQNAISKDNVSIKVRVIVYFRVLDPKLAIIAVPV